MAGIDSTQLTVGLERVAKVIARAGVCSRREAEGLIEEGRVRVNGSVIQSPALDVAASDKVEVDGAVLPARQAPRLWRYNKPKGRVTTHKDPEGRPTVFEALPDNLPRVVSVGRLDYNTEGLLLLTNDGELARHMELPSTGWARRYRVRAYGTIEQEALDALADGLTIDGVNYGPIEASVERDQGDNVWIALLIREGKNREVRRIMEHLGLVVNRLIRVSFGPFILGDLEPGQVEEVKTRMLQDQLGPRLTRQLGVKREPLREERSLAPKRDKPTYLRRKSTPENQRLDLMQAEPEREPRQRRIVPWDGASGEPVKVETVVEKPRRADRREGDKSGQGFQPRGERNGSRERNDTRPDFTRERPRSDTPGRKSFDNRAAAGEPDRPRAERPERVPFIRDREREGRPNNGVNRTSFGQSRDGNRDASGDRAFAGRSPRPPRENGPRPNGPSFRRDGGSGADRKDFEPKPYGNRDRITSADRGPAVKRDGWSPRITPTEGDENPAQERKSDREARPARLWTERPARTDSKPAGRGGAGRDAPFRTRSSDDKPFRQPHRSSEGRLERRSEGDRRAPRSGVSGPADRPHRNGDDRPFSNSDRGPAHNAENPGREGVRKPFVKRETSNRVGYDSRKGYGQNNSSRAAGGESRPREGARGESETSARNEPWKRDKPPFGSSPRGESKPARQESGQRDRAPRPSSKPDGAERRDNGTRFQDRSAKSGSRDGGGYKWRSSNRPAGGDYRKPLDGGAIKSAIGNRDRPRPGGDRDRSAREGNRAAKPFVARDRGTRAGDTPRPRPAPRKRPEGETEDA